VHDLACDQRTERRPEPDAFADRVEHRLAGHRGDPAAHLRIHDDADHADDDHPEQLIAEGRACCDVEDEIADVDEAADRREDSERDAEDLAHAQPPILVSTSSTSAPTPLSAGWSWRRSSVAASRTASFAFSRTFRSIPGTVFRRESASARLDDWRWSSSACSRAKYVVL